MRRFLTAFVVGLAIMLSACGSSTGTSASVNGTWKASLTATTGSSLSFTVVLSQNSTNSSTNNATTTTATVSGSNLVLSPTSSCFINGAQVSGTVGVTPNGSTEDIVGNDFTLFISSSDARISIPGTTGTNNTAAVDSPSSISGTWSEGGSCGESYGTFTMSRP